MIVTADNGQHGNIRKHSCIGGIRERGREEQNRYEGETVEALPIGVAMGETTLDMEGVATKTELDNSEQTCCLDEL